MGYNVYRDGVLVKKLDGKTTTWTDEKYTDDNGYGAGNHKYNVIVVYANGESDVSNTAFHDAERLRLQRWLLLFPRSAGFSWHGRDCARRHVRHW